MPGADEFPASQGPPGRPRRRYPFLDPQQETRQPHLPDACRAENELIGLAPEQEARSFWGPLRSTGRPFAPPKSFAFNPCPELTGGADSGGWPEGGWVIQCLGDLVHPACQEGSMPRLTITLSEERHRALKEAALRRGKTIRQIIEESLEHYGIKTRKEAADLVARARARAGLTEAEALSRAVEETRRERGYGAAPRGD